MHPIVSLARETIEGYLLRRQLPEPTPTTPEMAQPAGVFVSLKKQGQLRGCIGTFEPACACVAEEIVANALAAAFRDPRFPPVSAEELPFITYSVDILTPPQPVADPGSLDPKKHGLIVEAGWRRGLLLPDIEGVDTVEQQKHICCLKAGIAPHEPMRFYCFEVRRYTEATSPPP